MNPRTRLRLVALTVVALAAESLQSQTVARPQVDRVRVMRDTSSLATADFAGRETGSEGGRRARQWIVEQFTAIGLEPAGDRHFLQPFSFTDERTESGRRVRVEYRDAANVLGRVHGSAAARPIVISAHYDHLGTRGGRVYFGADDNASGVAVLLAAARQFVAQGPRHPLIFAAFDGEEQGLHGARAYVAARPATALNVNLDMVSRSSRNEIFAVGTHHYPQLKPLLEDVRSRASVKLLFGHDVPGSAGDWTHVSDHAPFHEAGVPFVYFGVDFHGDYHRPTDTAEKIDPRFLGGVADMVVDAIRSFDARLP